MNMSESKASPDADFSTFGHPGGVSDTEAGPVLGEIHINTPSLRLDASAVLDSTARDGRAGRVLYRLLLGILLLALAVLTDARRIGDAAALMLP